jgi:putative sterol carrier protein
VADTGAKREAGNVAQVFDRIAKIGVAPNLKGTTGVFRFDVDDVGSWRVSVDDGKVSVKKGGGDADAIIGLSAEDFMHLVRGEINLLTAYLRGDIRATGDIALAKKLHGVLPGQQGQAQFQPHPGDAR